MNLSKNILKLKETKGNAIIATFSTLCIFLQCILFQGIAFGDAVGWPFIPCLFIKLGIALFFAAFTLITKRKYWIVVVTFLLAIWCMAELIYLRANNILIDAYSITMVHNMDGVWSSIWIYNHFIDWLLLVPTALLWVVVYFFNNKSRNKWALIITIVISLLLTLIFGYQSHTRVMHHQPEECKHSPILNIFAKFDKDNSTFFGYTPEQYARNLSVFHSLIYNVKELVVMLFQSDVFELSDEDKQQIAPFVHADSIQIAPSSPIIVVLVESFESWAIHPDVTPNLCQFIDKTSSLLYASNMQSQVRNGVSADGQMIVNTGLLPITEGAACFRYPNNVYPAITHLYQNAGMIVAWDLSFWNQKFMSDAYGIKQNYVVQGWDDKAYLSKLDTIKSLHDCLITMTVTMHSPFNACPIYMYPRVEGMPEQMYKYVNSVKYVDQQLKSLLDQITHHPTFKNTTVVITADHKVFSPDARKQFEKFNTENQLGFNQITPSIPCIIYSPKIKEKVIITDTVYQMDVYPTILYLLDCQSYYWKGFGVNLMEKEAWKNRPIQPAEAQQLSDKLIRANYFKQLSVIQ